MKRLVRKSKGLIKGTPSAVLLSAVIHSVLLVVAGSLVVVTAIKKKEKQFVPPPPIERPKKPLIKPRVKMKKTVKTGSTQRITSKATRNMPDMQLPALEGMGEGLGSGIGGFELMPDFSDVTLFGGKKSVSVGNDFEGTFYSLQYDRKGKNLDTSHDKVLEVLKRFVELDWNPRVFSPYYRSPRKLYATQFMLPPFPSGDGPDAFGEGADPNFLPRNWCAIYKGKIASRAGGRFRFWSSADEILVVRVNKQVVLDDGWNEWAGVVTGWKSSSKDNLEYGMGNSGATVGDWFELQPETPVEMELLFEENGGPGGGGKGCLMLTVQQEGVDYPKTKKGAPVLPVFKTAEIPPSVRRKIEYTLIRTDAALEGGPTFNVY